MGIVERFERKLEGAVGDGFARVFGGSVVRREVEQALQREVTDGVRQLDGGHWLAPNRFTVTLSPSDHAQLAEDRQEVGGILVRWLTGYIAEQQWQTYGDIAVGFETSAALHTGQFRTSSSVDPDASHDTADSPPAHPGAAAMSPTPGHPPNPGQDGPAERPPASWDPHRGWSASPPAGEWSAQAPQSYPGQNAGQDYGPAGYGAPQQGGWNSGHGYYDQGYSGGQGYGSGQGYSGGQGYGSGQGYGGGQGYNDQGYGDQGYGAGPGYAAELTGALHLEDGSGRSYQLKSGANVIGRGQDAQFRLADTGVSRRHLEITWDGQVAMLTDLGSTNGTTVNGSPVQHWQLADGDIVRAGNSSIVVRIWG